MTVGLWQTAATEATAPRQAEVVVVGAGIIGSYLALRLTERHADVLVLEGRHIASGASGRNGGLLLSGIAHNYASACAHYGRAETRALWNITVRNREAMIDWATRLGTPVRRCGSYVLACSDEEAEQLQESVGLMAEDGFAAEWHPTDPLGRGFAAGLANSGDGAIQPALLTAALLSASGAGVRETSEVFGLESQADGVLVRARGGDVLAQQVVLATNAWTPLLLPEFAGTLVPARGQVLATGPAPRVLERACYCDQGFEYFQQLPDSRVVLGGYRNRAFAEEATYADQTTPKIQQALDAFLLRYFPELQQVPIELRWSGTMGFTRDGLPLIGRLKRDPRVSFAVGFNGHGLGLGLVVADELLHELAGSGTGGMFAARRLLPDIAA